MASKSVAFQHINRISLQINETCDSRCRLCDYWRLQNPREMSEEVLEGLVYPLLRDLSPLGNICVTGGEPTLHSALVRIMRDVSPLTQTLTLITTTSQLEKVYAGIRDSVSSYMISVDGADRGTYRQTRGVDLFDSAMAWISRLRAETAAAIAVSCVVQKGNFDQLEQIAEMAFSQGAHHVFFRVPSLTDDAFGRPDGVPQRTTRAATLTSEEVDVVQRQFVNIARGYTREQIPNVLDYGRYVNNLRGGPPPTGLSCDVPFTSMVIDPDGCYLPCFYMPFKVSLRDAEKVTELSSGIQRGILHDAAFRARHCDGCQQYVDRKRPVGELNEMYLRGTLSAAALGY